MSFKFSDFPILVTERLRLREITKSDGLMIFFLRTDKEINKYINRPKPHKNVKEAEDFIDKVGRGTENGENINWAITLHGETDIIGSICLWNFSDDRRKAELGYDLDTKFQNQGIMSEALKEVLNFGFIALNLDEIEAFTHYGNENSKRLLVKNNFILNRERKDEGNPNNLIFELSKMAAEPLLVINK